MAGRTRYAKLDSINTLINQFGLPRFLSEELDLLTEYVSVLEPIAKVLDVFQGEKADWMGIGIVLPLLERLKSVLCEKNLPNLYPLRERVLAKIEQRFAAYYTI